MNKLNTIDDLKNVSQEDINPLPPPICPMEGEFIGYKKCMVGNLQDECLPVIVTLKIPADALRVSPFTTRPIRNDDGIIIEINCNERSRKCRCSYAEVIKIEDVDGNQYQGAISVMAHIFTGETFIYEVGKLVYADEFDSNETTECSHGIHFFMTQEEAENFMG